jgi:chromatin remodeling complex protein RSC6
MPATKGKRTKKTTTPDETTQQPATPTQLETVSVVTEPVEVTETQVATLTDEFNDLLNTVTALKTTLSSLSTRLRGLQKRAERDIKSAQKQKKKRGPLSADGKPRKPSGFVKPTDITPELAKFLGKDKGVQMARTEVTREINKYIREHQLQDPSNGRIIKPDASLRKLLNVKPKDELTYFNLQKFMSPHFVKSVQVSA